MLGSAERKVPNVITREIIFEEFQRMRSQSTNVSDVRTDGRTTHIVLPRYTTLREVKIDVFDFEARSWLLGRSQRR